MNFSKRKNRSFRKIIIFISLNVIVMGIPLVSFRIRNIECYSQFGSCPEGTVETLTEMIGKPLLFPLPVNLVNRKLSDFTQIKSLSLHRRIPSTMIVAVQLRQPLGSIGNSVLGAQVIVDQEGFVFQKISQSSLPTLLTRDIPEINSSVSQNYYRSLSALSKVSTLFDTQISGKLENNYLIITGPNNLQIIIDIAKSDSNWYTPLQLILHRSKINAKMPQKIDFRFTDTVVSY